MTQINPEQRNQAIEKFHEYSAGVLQQIAQFREGTQLTPTFREINYDHEFAENVMNEAEESLSPEVLDYIVILSNIEPVIEAFENPSYKESLGQAFDRVHDLPTAPGFSHGAPGLLDDFIRVTGLSDSYAVPRVESLPNEMTEALHQRRAILNPTSIPLLKAALVHDTLLLSQQIGKEIFPVQSPNIRHFSEYINGDTPEEIALIVLSLANAQNNKGLRSTTIRSEIYNLSGGNPEELGENTKLHDLISRLEAIDIFYRRLDHEKWRHEKAAENPEPVSISKEWEGMLLDGVWNAVAAARLALESYGAELEQNPTKDAMEQALILESSLDAFVKDLPAKLDGLVEGGTELRPRALVREHMGTPLYDAVRSAEEEAEHDERVKQMESIKILIEELDKTYRVSSRDLRELDPGFKFSRSIESNLFENGSKRYLFRQDEARLLAATILSPKLDLENLRLDLQTLGNLHQKRLKLGSHEPAPSLFKVINTLRERYELGELSQKSQLKPLAEFIERLDGLNEGSSDDLLAKTDWDRPVRPERNDILDLPKKPFPPESRAEKSTGTKEIEEKDIDPDKIADDVEKEISNSHGGGYVVEQERIDNFIDLYERMKSQFGDMVTMYRTQHSSWHPLPYYVIELGNDVAIAESPIYGNASYIIPSIEWKEIIEFSRRDAKQLGALAVVHPNEDAKVGSDYHVRKLYDLVVDPL